MAIESTFCVASGLIKISILLFYKRLGARAVSKTFLWATRLTIIFIAGYSIAFTLVPVFGCNPISAFWDQVDFIKVSNGYTYKCFNEGADVFAAAVISSAQDLLTAILPTFLYWRLRIPLRQKIALFGIFAIGYGVVAIGILRSYYSWQIFFETYDVTWVAWNVWTWTLLEIHIGAICANVPALKVFFKQILKIKTSSAGSNSVSKISGTRSSASKPSRSSFSASAYSRRSLWKDSQQNGRYGYLSEPHHEIPVHGHDSTPTQQEVCDSCSAVSERSLVNTKTAQWEDIELATLQKQPQSQSKYSVQSLSPSQEDLQALPQMPSQIRPYLTPRAMSPEAQANPYSSGIVNEKLTWQSWS
ncbi:hypothetical protein N0V90_004398 [Kalmusia sp. IMI 367209]|nr:hypothetical protein N0V90_004398 [Kalmusia sp. IMI 367209]